MIKPIILFESYPDFNGSALEVYNEFVKRGYDKKYDLVWGVYDNFNLSTDKKVIKLFNSKNNKIINYDIFKNVKCIIDSNRYIPKISNIFRIHLRHGVCLKNILSYCHSIGPLDAIPTTSDEMLEIDRKCYPANISNKFIVVGMPSTDRLFHPNNLYNGFIQELTKTDNKFTKIIGWLPTFRDHRFYSHEKNRFTFGLPAIHSIEEYNKLNEKLKNENILLIVQMHHAQAKNYKQLPNATNIVFVNEQLKNKYNIATTDMLGNFDALLTDYSAAYHEYIMLNKPIGLAIEDLVQFSKTKGFVCNYLDWIKGDYILDCNHLIDWVDNISKNIDKSKNEREKSLNRIHKFKDDKATIRVVDYLVKNAKL